uniref:50S ribosomal protein L32, chloroplastic n=1 Tax=Haptolina brevifila TaxID=156173 RepID=A0A7S2MFI0_9EUKA
MARLVFVLVALACSLASAMRVSLPVHPLDSSSSSIRVQSSSSSSVSYNGALIVAGARGTRTQQSDISMAVPKKRQSKMKTRQRKANWFAKARRQATLALSRGKSVNYNPLEDPKYAFDAPADDEDDEDEDEE